jgi:hypothetical protein
MRKLIILVLLCLLTACSNAYYVKAYKSDAEIYRGNEQELKSRFTTVNFNDFEFFLEWYTYDNTFINRPPYKLFVVLAPKNQDLENVSIESVMLGSSLGNSYEISESVEFPVILRNNPELKRSSYTFEPAFDFRFSNEEIIRSEIVILITVRGKVERKVLKHRWLPIRVKHYAPIV